MKGLGWVSTHTNGVLRGTEIGPPLGVNSGDIEGDSLEPEHHEQSLGEGAVPNLGPITASLKSNPHPKVRHGTPHLPQAILCPTPLPDHTIFCLIMTHSLRANSSPQTWALHSGGRVNLRAG